MMSDSVFSVSSFILVLRSTYLHGCFQLHLVAGCASVPRSAFLLRWILGVRAPNCPSVHGSEAGGAGEALAPET